MSATGNRLRIGPVQVGVILLALTTAIVHLYIWLIEGIFSGLAPEQQMGPIYQVLFVANFFGYLTLLLALYLPIPLLMRFRPLTRIVLISMAFASIASYFHVGAYDTIGNVDKIVEVLLIMLLTVDAGMSNFREELAGR